MKKEVVEISTQEEWDYVIEKSTYIDAKSPAHNFRNVKRYFNTNFFGYDSRKKYYTSLGYSIISFNEFKSRYELKIGDIFEKDGFICEVKEKIEEKKWYLLKSPDNKTISYEKLGREDLKDINHLYTKQEITDQEFINQLEKYSK